MNTLTATKADLILVKVGGVQISQHSRILIKSDNGRGEGTLEVIIEWDMGGGHKRPKVSYMIFQHSLKTHTCDCDK